jgi:DNA-binding MarR family transcriptional regulator
MSSKQQHRQDLAMKYMHTMRRFLRMGVGWTNLAAQSLGVHPTDLILCGNIFDEGPMTAGRLAETVGMTTGAMTAAIDRLVLAGFAQRVPDPQDKRKVIIRPTKVPAQMLSMREESMKSIASLFSRYSDKDLAFLNSSMLGVMEAFEKEIPSFKKALAKRASNKKT